MTGRIIRLFVLVCLPACSINAYAAVSPLAETAQEPVQYLGVSVDNVVFDSGGLVQASQSLSDSITLLAIAMDRLSTDGAELSDSERQQLMEAVKSIDRASDAMSELAIRLPDSAQKLTDQLPRMIENARAPIAYYSEDAGYSTFSKAAWNSVPGPWAREVFSGIRARPRCSR